MSRRFWGGRFENAWGDNANDICRTTIQYTNTNSSNFQNVQIDVHIHLNNVNADNQLSAVNINIMQGTVTLYNMVFVYAWVRFKHLYASACIHVLWQHNANWYNEIGYILHRSPVCWWEYEETTSVRYRWRLIRHIQFWNPPRPGSY